MIKYLVWDFDGTIADTDLCVLNNIKDVMKMYGIVEPDEMILDAMKRQSSSVAVKYMADKYHKFTVEEFYEKWTKYEAEFKLTKSCNLSKTYRLDNYTMTVTTENPMEEFDLYLDTKKEA